MATTSIVVVGAGVLGLSTALVLSKHKGLDITVVAKHMPGDFDIEYASPWAGANFFPVGAPGSDLQKFEKATWGELDRICREVPEAGIHFQETKTYGRKKDAGTAVGQWFQELVKEDAWFKDVVPNFRVLPKSELPPDAETGTTFTSVCMNVSVYLPWILGQCVKNGVTIRRGILSHISEAGSYHSSGKADITLNCTGLLASKLGGVMDASVYPGRGQIVVVRNEPGVMVTVSGTDDGDEEATYIMQRAVGGGTVLGGCLQHGSWESQPDPNLAQRIMQRSIDLCPSLVPKTGKVTELSIIRHGVGLRPMRKGGPRVEKEKIDGNWIVHNYGHAGYGYQSGWGSAWEAEKLVLEILKQESVVKAKL
ncbi:FAD dependent oxidoreductase [Dothidotthia symphoricarpi CBS 119687]|uniref:FAD dependent oxidoreductase n=1 Tax=Dothidotthia symphoricarpi CBS 119687 TaxID=1392245 RepID=A0A6A6ACQ8_9PLEO|nr:FAD dependent oxidoreductase [Dothidotthia symphoricarpi CBS 119687]KAF2129560.1 FAD dependent oxidoreductase [Dothidotthia symphoricarpi CBS 119687]